MLSSPTRYLFCSATCLSLERTPDQWLCIFCSDNAAAFCAGRTAEVSFSFCPCRSPPHLRSALPRRHLTLKALRSTLPRLWSVEIRLPPPESRPLQTARTAPQLRPVLQHKLLASRVALVLRREPPRVVQVFFNCRIALLRAPERLHQFCADFFVFYSNSSSLRNMFSL